MTRPRDVWRALGIFVVCGALYVRTLTPGLAHLGGDGHELTVVAATLGLAHPTGYPLYTWIGHLFTLLPIGDVAYRTNLMSAVLGAAGVALLYLVARRLALRPGIAVFTALLFGVTTTFWSQAVITEVYAPNAFALALVLWLLLRWAEQPAADGRLTACALAYGLSLGMHFSNAAFAPAIALFVWLTDRTVFGRPRAVGAAGLAFLLGAAQFAWLPLRAHAHDLFPNAPPDTPAAFYEYTLGAFAILRFAFPVADVPAQLAAYVALLAETFSMIGVVAGVAGMWALLQREPRAFWLLFSMYAIHVVWFSQLLVPDPEPFFVASNLIFALFVGCGLEALRAAIAADDIADRSTAVAFAGGAALAVWLVPMTIAGFRANDQSHDTIVGDFHAAVFQLLPPDSILIPPRGAFGSDVTYYRRVLGMRPDLRVPDDSWQTLPPGVPAFTLVDDRALSAVRYSDRAWIIPALRGARHDATLYRILETPPPLVVREAAPEFPLDRALGPATLVGYDAPVTADRFVTVKTYWRVSTAARVVIATRADGTMLEAHELGFGNLSRYRVEQGFREGGIVVEELGIVLPSTLTGGAYALAVGVVDPAAGIVLHWTPLGRIGDPS